MRILGIDPGLRTTGFGVIDVEGAQLSYVASGTISTLHLDKGELPARLKVLFDGIREVARRYQPDCASVEIVFVNVNPQSTLLLGQARGACITALVCCDLPVAEYTALQMKQAVVGYGRAQKTQVQEMVRRLLALPACPARTPPTRWAWPSPTPTRARPHACTRWPQRRSGNATADAVLRSGELLRSKHHCASVDRSNGTCRVRPAHPGRWAPAACGS